MRPEELESLALREPLCYGITYIYLGQNRLWEVEERPWMPEIYSVVNPYQIERSPAGMPRYLAIMKSTQCGMSTMGIIRTFHFADFWPVRVFYMLPREKDYIDFVNTRIDPMISSSPRLKSKLGSPDSTRAKQLGNSYLFFMEASVEPRMMPADMLMADEVDLSDQTHVSTALNRMDDSSWKLEYYFSTPTISNYGIHARFGDTDKREWLVKCRYCSSEQPLDWEKNLAIVGARNNPKAVFYVCAHCHKMITQADIRAGRWVAEHPDRAKDKIGFHVSQMMTYSAPALYKIFRDPQTKLVEFYRKRLGMPYELGEGSLEREDFLINCFVDPYNLENIADGESAYYMGVDQGNELQVTIGKIPPNSQERKLVYAEAVPFEKGFGRVGKLMRLFRIKRCIVDANPNRHSATALQKNFPGRILLADYVEQRDRYKIIYDKGKGKRKIPVRVNMARTDGFDNLFEGVRKGLWSLPGLPTNLPPIIELVIDNMTALRRDIEERKTLAGTVQVGVYRAIRKENFAHSWHYMNTAMDVDQARRTRVAVANPPNADEEEEEILEIPVDPEVLAKIVYFLAEVPAEQLKDFLVNQDNPDYDKPFPLSYKYKRASENNSNDDIIKVIEWMVQKEAKDQNDKRRKRIR